MRRSPKRAEPSPAAVEAPGKSEPAQLSLIEPQAPAPAAAAEAAELRAPLGDGPRPTAEQRAAIAARRRDAFLEAGAGTGKTTVLVERYCAAVAEDAVEVERILAFTFTERAAAELRSRVRRELTRRGRAALALSDAARGEQLIGAARATERAWMMTMHAFCRRLLASHPIAAGLDPRFRVLDAAEAGRLRTRAADAALDELLAAGDQQVGRAAAAYQPWRLTAMAVSASERLRSQGMREPRLPPVQAPVYSPKAAEELRELTSSEQRAAEDARAALERLLEGFGRRYEELKEERSALDFQDLELRALELLRSSPAVAAAWRGRFEHLMIDEFQDTNSVQLALVSELRGPETRVFEVGDENQSIYRFRNADLEVFRAERRRARDDDDRDVLPLRGNFRSLPAVLAGVNEVGRTLLDGFVELTAGRSSGEQGSVELLLTLDEGRARDARSWDAEEIDLEPPAGSALRIVAEARCLATRLRELVDAGLAERGEIVVLLRAFTHVDAFEEALRRAGLRPFVVGGRGYWTQQQVEDLIRLLGVVANPLDDEYLFGALASFAVGISPDALWLLRRAARDDEDRPRHVWPLVAWRFGSGEEPQSSQPAWLDEIPEPDAERLTRFCHTLAAVRAEAPLLPLEELVERTMSAFGYDLGLIAREGGPGRMANVRKLMRLAREYEGSEGRDLGGFLALASESTRRDEREGMAALAAEGHDGVRVMTVHAAKGLQFPVVVVPDLGRALNAGRRNEDVFIGPLDPAGEAPRFGMRLAFAASAPIGLWELVDLDRAESTAEAEEGCRLVYVAASRAEDRLILSGIYKPPQVEPAPEPKPGDSPLRRLLPALAARGWDGREGIVSLPGAQPLGARERLADAELRIQISEPGPKRALELVRRHQPPPAPDPLAAASGPPPLLDRRRAGVPVGHLSYSALSQYERCGYRFYVERVLGAREALTPPAGDPAASGDDGGKPEDELVEPARGRALGRGIGNAVHAALEWSARRDWRPPPAELLDALIRREAFASDPDAAARVRELVFGWLGSPLCAEIAGARAQAEVPFVLGLGESVVRGQIDLLVGGVEEPATVIDYKTDALAGRRPAELAARYRAQREVYALAAGNGQGARAIHVFLEAADDPVMESFDARGLERARTRLQGLIAGMQGGSFEVTADPYPALCFGCPAAARLCPRPAWRPRAG